MSWAHEFNLKDGRRVRLEVHGEVRFPFYMIFIDGTFREKSDTGLGYNAGVLEERVRRKYESA